MIQLTWGREELSFWEMLVPFLGPFLGVSLPIILGFAYYKYQKKIDRDEQIHTEKRQAYRDCLAGFAQLAAHNGQRLADPDVDPDGSALIAAMKGDALAALYGNEKVVEITQLCMNELMRKDDTGAHIPELLAAMKDDLGKNLGR